MQVDIGCEDNITAKSAQCLHDYAFGSKLYFALH